jgi:dihydrofolate reductase
MPRLIVYIATSADGYIATPDGGIDWLAPYDATHYGYESFLASIGAIVMGRRTFEGVVRAGAWPYPGKKAYVLTRRKLSPPPGIEMEACADLDALIARLRRPGRPDIWIEGGGTTVRTMLDRGAVDRIDLFVIPVLLGDGIRLFPPSPRRHGLALESSRAYSDGVIALSYRVEAA